MHNNLKLLLRLSLGIGILLALCWSVDLKAVAANLTNLNVLWFVWLCLLAVLIKILKAYKWWLLLRARELDVSAWQSTRLYFAGYLVGALTPAGVGSDIYRTSALSNFQKNNDVVSTLLLERLIGYAVLAAAAVLSMPFSARYLDPVVFSVIWTVVVIALLLACLLLVLLRSGLFDSLIRYVLARMNLADKFSNLWSAFSEFRHHKGLLTLFTLLTGFEILILVLISYTAARALGIHAPFIYLLSLIPLMQFLIRLPISFQALGIQEGLYVYVFVAAGYPASDGLSVSILLRAVEIILVFLPGLIMLVSRSHIRASQQ
ncbi:MAG: lysylphosphatidylglycerol synthase transmembrane domain-containing protein [Pseudomonadota bacterium]